jgi:hypothetical protein
MSSNSFGMLYEYNILWNTRWFFYSFLHSLIDRHFDIRYQQFPLMMATNHWARRCQKLLITTWARRWPKLLFPFSCDFVPRLADFVSPVSVELAAAPRPDVAPYIPPVSVPPIAINYPLSVVDDAMIEGGTITHQSSSISSHLISCRRVGSFGC